MSTIKTNTVQIGQSATATNNFTLYQPTVPDGTVRIGNGNAGAATDKITINSAGNITATGELSVARITPEREKALSLAAGAIDLATGNYFYKVLAADVTFSLTNVPTTGTAQSFILEISNGGSYVITWFSGVKWAFGSAPLLSVSPGRDVLSFFTRDGGVTWNGFLVGKNML